MFCVMYVYNNQPSLRRILLYMYICNKQTFLVNNAIMYLLVNPLMVRERNEL